MGSLIRFVEFFTIDFASDLTFLGVWTMIYTTMEPCAYFVCACLPGTRPLARWLYYKSGLRATLRSRYHTNKTGSKSTSHRAIYDISAIGKPYGSHSATITTSGRKGGTTSSLDDDTAGFIRLEETFQVENTSRRTSPGGWDAGHAV